MGKSIIGAIMTTKKYIIGNWKMNPASFVDAKKIFTKIATKIAPNKKVTTVICPPVVYLAPLSQVKKNVVLGAQDIFYEQEGAFTGSISASMVKNFAVEYVIIGHSERRKAGDTDEIINHKLLAALREGLKVILCVGEAVHDEAGAYLKDLQRQLEQGLAGAKKYTGQIIIAHEPVWAIGAAAKGADTPESFQHNRLFIKKILAGIFGQKNGLMIPILYGGSANAKNAGDFLGAGDADGLLVGRASLIPSEFIEIITIANLTR